MPHFTTLLSFFTLLLYSVFMLFLSRRGNGNIRGQFIVTSTVPRVLFAPFLSPIACVCSENPHQDQWRRWSFPLHGAEMTTVNGIAVAHVRYDKLALPRLCRVGSPYEMFYAHYYVFFLCYISFVVVNFCFNHENGYWRAGPSWLTAVWCVSFEFQ